jgi:hypothetical protein
VHNKAVKGEHKTALVLSEARHKHELAVASENNAMNDFRVRVVVVNNLNSPDSIYTSSLPTMSLRCFTDLILRCARGTSRRPMTLWKAGVRSSRKLNAVKMPET